MSASSPTAVPEAGLLPLATNSPEHQHRVRVAKRVFYICLGYTSAMTLFWIFLLVSGKQNVPFFPNYKPTAQQLAGLVVFFSIFMVGTGYLFYLLKRWLSRRLLGLTPEEMKVVFSNRLESFELSALLARHSERRIRIVDMIGRRGRWAPMALMGFLAIYFQTRQNPNVDGLMLGVQASVVDGLVMAWWTLLTFHNNGFFGNAAYGATARTLDGVQGRANALFIGTLWGLFRFVMVPVALQLAAIYPPSAYASLFAFIWLTYIAADYASEIFGSLCGRHFVRVWGIGDMNKKSWEGVVAGFVATLLLTMTIIYANGLPASWIGLGVLLSITNPLVELYSPRATDDFTMATSNALLCWGYGLLFLR